MKRFVWGAVILGAVLAGLFGLRYFQLQSQQQAMSQAPPPAAVEAYTTTTERWQGTLAAIGELRAVNGIRIANEIAGVVDSIEFESGQRVEQGDLLIHLDDETDQAALETRLADSRLAQQQFERFADLVGQSAVSQADYDEAQANYQAAQARVNEQRALLAKKSIRAPFAGTLGLRQVDLGEFVPVGTPIVEINTLDPIQVDFTIGERFLPLIAMGDPIEITVAAFPDQTFRGSVLAIESSVRATTRTVQVRAQLPNPDRILRPGMFASVTLFRNTSRDAITVPRTAISYNTYGDFVFALTEADGQTTVERVQVDTGDIREGRVEILDGLSEGQRIVANGLNRLRSGQPVQVVESTDSEGTATGAR